jgi:hypothetical protein
MDWIKRMKRVRISFTVKGGCKVDYDLNIKDIGELNDIISEIYDSFILEGRVCIEEL